MTDRSYRVRLEADVAGFIAQVGVQAVAAVNRLGDAADKVNSRIDRIGAGAAGIGSRIGAGAQAGASRLDTLLTAADKNSSALNELGGQATRIGVVAAAGLGAAAKAAIDWESAWAGVTKTVDGSASQMAELEGQLRGMAKTLPATHQEIAAVAEAAGQLGIQRENIASFTKVMVDLGETTNLTAEDAATSLAQFMNVLQTSPQNVGRLGASLVALGNDGASTERDILSMATRISSTGAIIGLSETQVLAYASALSNVGIEAEAGGSAISSVFLRIDKAVSQGGESLDNFARVSGLSTAAFKQQFQTDAAGATQAFIEGLGRMNQAGGDVNATLEALGITEIRQRAAVLSLAASGTNLADSLQTAADGWRENTALVDEAAKRYETTESQIRISWNNIKDAAITAGAAMLPIIASIAEGVANVAEFFGNLPAPVRNTAAALTAIVAVGGLVAGVGLKMVTSLAAAKVAMTDLGVSSKTAGTALGAIGKASLAVGIAMLAAELKNMVEITKQMDISGLSADLIRFGETGRVTGELVKNFGTDLSGLTKSFRADGDSLAEMFATVGREANSGFERFEAWMDGGSEASKRIKELDEALSTLVEGGNADSAAKAFSRFEEVARSQGVSLATLRDIFPEYGAALDAAGVDAEAAGQKAAGAAGPNKDLASSLQGVGESAEDAASRVKEYIENLLAMPNLVLSVRDAQRGVQAAIDDATDSLKENGRTLDINKEKGRANQEALDGIAGAANRQSEALYTANASQKTLTATATSARAAFVNAATGMGMSKAAAEALAAQLIKIPTSKETVLKNNAPAATTPVKTYNETLGAVPNSLPTILRNNAPAATAPVKTYAERLGLVPPNVQTFVKNDAPVAKTKIDQYRTALGLIPPGKSTTVSAPGAVGAEGQVLGLAGAVRGLPSSKTVTITYWQKIIGVKPDTSVGVRPNADGGIWPLNSYANGKLPSQAVVQPAMGGRGLVQWAEPETGGEAFIPLAPSKRDRSTAILGQVADAFGFQLVRSFADGGFLPGGRLVDIAFLLRQLGIPFNPSAGVNYGATLQAQNKANLAIPGAMRAKQQADRAEAAAKAEVARLQRAITLQQREINKARSAPTSKSKDKDVREASQAAKDKRVKQEQAELIKLQDQLYRAKNKQKAASDAQNKAEDLYQKKVDAAKKATEAHKDAIEKLVAQQKAAVEMAGQIADALTSSANIGDLFQDSLSGKGLLADLQAKGADLGRFRGQVDRLRAMGLSEDLITQIIGKGAEQGGEVAQAILDGGLGLVGALNKAQKALDDQANLIGAGSANKKFGQAIAGARASGGPVQQGLTYWVGENGRELFTAPANGYVHANSAVDPNRYVHSGGGWSGGGGKTITREDHYHQTVVNHGVSMAEADLIAQRAAGRMRMMGRR